MAHQSISYLTLTYSKSTCLNTHNRPLSLLDLLFISRNAYEVMDGGDWVELGIIKVICLEDLFLKSQIKRKELARVGFEEIKII